jgi:CheY-like chemotaxis protein
MPYAPLASQSVLVVEDEALVRILIEDMLLRLGCLEVQSASTLTQAMSTLDSFKPDVAVLDVFLQGEQVYPVAERLDELSVPFVFATGFGRKGMLEPWASRCVIQKPFSAQALKQALMDVGAISEA